MLKLLTCLCLLCLLYCNWCIVLVTLQHVCVKYGQSGRGLLRGLLSGDLLTFDVHGSVHLGKIYVQLKVQLDVLFMYSLFLALHVSGAICTHPQEHKCSARP
jgi:hypothetical protein